MKKLFGGLALALVFMFTIMPFASANILRDQVAPVVMNENITPEQKIDLIKEKSAEEIRAIAEERGIDPTKAVLAANNMFRTSVQERWNQLSPENQEKIKDLDPIKQAR